MRKSFLLLSLTILFPYLVIFAIICVFSGFLMESVFQNNAITLLQFLFVVYFAALISTVIFIVANLHKQQSALGMARINMVIKLIHIPAYLVIFIMGLLSFVTIFTMPFALFFFLFDCMTIFLTGLIGASGILKGFREEKVSKESANIHGILQFLFCIDVISAIIIHRKIRLAPTQ